MSDRSFACVFVGSNGWPGWGLVGPPWSSSAKEEVDCIDYAVNTLLGGHLPQHLDLNEHWTEIYMTLQTILRTSALKTWKFSKTTGLPRRSGSNLLSCFSAFFQGFLSRGWVLLKCLLSRRGIWDFKGKGSWMTSWFPRHLRRLWMSSELSLLQVWAFWRGFLGKSTIRVSRPEAGKPDLAHSLWQHWNYVVLSRSRSSRPTFLPSAFFVVSKSPSFVHGTSLPASPARNQVI